MISRSFRPSFLRSTVPPYKAGASDSSLPAKSVASLLRTVLIVSLGYYAGTRIGFAFTPSAQPNSVFWPPNAVLLAALLLIPRQSWWAVLVSIIPAHLFAQLEAGVPMGTAVGWLLTNTAEAVIGAFCITRLAQPTKLFNSVRGVFIFVIFGVLIAPLATSFLDAGAVVLTGWGRGYLPVSAQRFWTNALAELIIVPVLVLFATEATSWIHKGSFAQYCEAGLLGFSVVFVTVSVFGLQPVSVASFPAVLYLPLLLLLWATARFGLGGLSSCMLVMSLLALWYVIHGKEPFPSASLAQNVLSLQILLSTVALPLIFLSAYMTENREIQESLRQTAGSLIDAQEQERHRIARELHDGLSQQLALVQVRLNAVVEQADSINKSALKELMKDVSAVSTAAHEISHGLYPSQLEYLGLGSALTKLCDDAQQGGVSVHLTIKDVPRQLPASTSLCLYRVAQEALRNISSHSQAKTAWVDLGTEHERISLRIIDDGMGFDLKEAGAGLGLASMRQRVLSLGGSIEISSGGKAGTRIAVILPKPQTDIEKPFGAA